MKDQFSNRRGLGSETASPDAAFANPDMFYAPNAFWYWNGLEDISHPELFVEQVRGMRSQNLNPGYVHARFWRANTPFWHSEDWFKSFTTAVEECERQGVHMGYTMGDPAFPDKYLMPDHEHRPAPKDYYSPEPLPSCPELETFSLRWSVQDVAGGELARLPESLFSVAAELDASGRLLSASLRVVGEGSVSEWKAPAGGSWRVYSYSKYRGNAPASVNFLDRRLAAPWLSVENAAYERTVGEHFGKAMRGVFFDLEGCYGYKLAWSDDVPKTFAKLKGADVRLTLPLLFEEDAEGLWPKARWDWFDVIGKLYIECVFEPLDKWCRDKGMFMTCHFWEERLFMQAVHVGNYFAMQRAYSMPGTDALFETIRDPRYSRETQSVAEFEGRQFMCEAFAVAGCQLSSTDLKKDLNCAVAFGVSHLVLGGVDSNPELRSISYPPDIYHWNPYWRNFKLLADFCRRACHVNDHGRLDAETLLLCPMDSVWALTGEAFFDADRQPYLVPACDAIHEEKMSFAHLDEIVKIDDVYSDAMQALTAARVEHLTADSHYLEMMKVGADGRLSLGDFSFKTLVLPPLKLLRLETARRIVEFARAGGEVFALGSLPDASAERGLNDPELKKLMDALRSAKGFVDAKRGLSGLEPSVSFTSGEFPLIVSRRKIGGRRFYWLVNNEDVKHGCVLRFAGAAGRAEIWDCEDGSRRELGSLELDGASEIALTLEPNEAFWLVFDPKKPALKPRAVPTFATKLVLDGEWTVSVDASCQPNLAQHQLAAPDWLLAGGAKRKLESWLNWDLRQFTGFVDYQLEFELAAPSGDEVFDLGEVKHVAEVWVNGELAGAKLWAPFHFAVGKFLRPGRNRVKVKVGNLIVNAMTQYQDLKWKINPTEAQLDAGLFGPVVLR